MKPDSFPSFAKTGAMILCAMMLVVPASANERKVDVWYDGDGNPRRVTVVHENGKTTLVEIDPEKPGVWKTQLKLLGVDLSVFGEKLLPETKQLGNSHQLMQYRGFDRNALPEGTYFGGGWRYGWGYGYPIYTYPRGGGHYCRPHHPRRRGGGIIIKF